MLDRIKYFLYDKDRFKRIYNYYIFNLINSGVKITWEYIDDKIPVQRTADDYLNNCHQDSIMNGGMWKIGEHIYEHGIYWSFVKDGDLIREGVHKLSAINSYCNLFNKEKKKFMIIENNIQEEETYYIVYRSMTSTGYFHDELKMVYKEDSMRTIKEELIVYEIDDEFVIIKAKKGISRLVTWIPVPIEYDLWESNKRSENQFKGHPMLNDQEYFEDHVKEYKINESFNSYEYISRSLVSNHSKEKLQRYYDFFNDFYKNKIVYLKLKDLSRDINKVDWFINDNPCIQSYSFEKRKLGEDIYLNGMYLPFLCVNENGENKIKDASHRYHSLMMFAKYLENNNKEEFEKFNEMKFPCLFMEDIQDIGSITSTNEPSFKYNFNKYIDERLPKILISKEIDINFCIIKNLNLEDTYYSLETFTCLISPSLWIQNIKPYYKIKE